MDFTVEAFAEVIGLDDPRHPRYVPPTKDEVQP
jgi:hypothetical protein